VIARGHPQGPARKSAMQRQPGIPAAAPAALAKRSVDNSRRDDQVESGLNYPPRKSAAGPLGLADPGDDLGMCCRVRFPAP